jgi:hypothetical protein
MTRIKSMIVAVVLMNMMKTMPKASKIRATIMLDLLWWWIRAAAWWIPFGGEFHGFLVPL